MILLLSILVALLLHVLLGWQWSLAGGLIAGFFYRGWGWLIGAMAVGFSWMVLVVYNFAVAPVESTRMTRTVGDLMGNLEGSLVVLATISLGLLVGAMGGTLGAMFRQLYDTARRQTPDSTDLEITDYE